MSLPQAARVVTLAAAIGYFSSPAIAQDKPDLITMLEQQGIEVMDPKDLAQYTARIQDYGQVPDPTDHIKDRIPDMNTFDANPNNHRYNLPVGRY